MKPLAHERATTDTQSIRAQRIDAVIICSDDSLLIELGPLLGERYRTHTVDAPADIGGTVEATRWIGIVDVDCLADARGAVAGLELQYQRCPLILVAARPEEWAAVVARGAALAAVGRQDVSGVRLAEALTIAEARLRESDGAPAAHRSGVAGSAADSEREATDEGLAGRPLGLMVAGVVLVALLAALGGWRLHQSRARARAVGAQAQIARVRALPAVPDAAGAAGNTAAGSGAASNAVANNPVAANGTGSGGSPAAVPATARPQSVLELLSAARVAFHDQKLLLPRTDGPPRGDSALELYTQVLRQDPGNDEALDGVRRLFAIGKDRIQSDLAGGRLDDASQLVALLAAAGVSADTLQGLRASIAAARPHWLAQRVQQAVDAGQLTTAQQLIGQLTASGTDARTVAALRRALDAKQLELQLTAMAAQVRAAIQAGALLDPANDNARTRWVAMRTLARAHPLTLGVQHDLQAALLQRVGEATNTGQFDQAQRFLGAAAELGSAATTSEARHQLQSAMAARAAARERAAAAAASAQQAATAATLRAAPLGAQRAPRPSYIAAHPVRALRVSYPDGTNAEGSVIVEFTLEPNGSASDASVVRSTPPGVFDQVALSAVLRGRYSTARLVNGEPLRARIRLSFRP